MILKQKSEIKRKILHQTPAKELGEIVRDNKFLRTTGKRCLLIAPAKEGIKRSNKC